MGPVRPPARSPASGQSSRRVRTRRDAPYSGGKKGRAFIDAVGIRENGPPVPSVSLDSIRAAVTAKAHPKLRAAAAKVGTGGVVPRRTRATAATVDASATTMASSAQRMETLAEDREPRADKIRAVAQAAAKEAAAKENKTAARAAAKAKGHNKRKRRASTPEPDPQLAQAWSENGPRLSFEMLKHDEKTREMCTNLTGMPSADVCVKFYELLNVNRRAENLVLYDYRGDGNASGRGEGEEPKRAREGRRAIKAPDAYLMTLVMLHKGLDQKFTGWLFGVHQNTLAPYFITWLQFLKQYLSELMPFPTREQIDETTPPRYNEVYGEAPRVILDGVELALENPKQLENYRATFSECVTRSECWRVAPNCARLCCAQVQAQNNRQAAWWDLAGGRCDVHQRGFSRPHFRPKADRSEWRDGVAGRWRCGCGGQRLQD